jgi:hypothetical protein
MLDRHTPWSRLCREDEVLYQNLAGGSDIDSFAYEANWAFAAQEARNLGMKRLHNGTLWVAVLRYDESPFVFVLPPIGGAGYRMRDVRAVESELRELTGRRVIFRKVFGQGLVELMRAQEAAIVAPSTFADSRDLPEDVRPQIIIDVVASLAAEGRSFVKLRNQIRHFTAKHVPRVSALSPENLRDARDLVASWVHEGRAPCGEVGDRLPEPPNDVFFEEDLIAANGFFAQTFADRIDHRVFFGQLVYVTGSAVAFTFAGRTSARGAALYTSLSLSEFRGASEYAISCMLSALRDAGVSHLNLGGAENDALFRFKTKFHVTHVREAYDVELKVEPASTTVAQIACARDMLSAD